MQACTAMQETWPSCEVRNVWTWLNMYMNVAAPTPPHPQTHLYGTVKDPSAKTFEEPDEIWVGYAGYKPPNSVGDSVSPIFFRTKPTVWWTSHTSWALPSYFAPHSCAKPSSSGGTHSWAQIIRPELRWLVVVSTYLFQPLPKCVYTILHKSDGDLMGRQGGFNGDMMVYIQVYMYTYDIILESSTHFGSKSHRWYSTWVWGVPTFDKLETTWDNPDFRSFAFSDTANIQIILLVRYPGCGHIKSLSALRKYNYMCIIYIYIYTYI